MFCENRERNLPYANVTYNLLLLSTGTQRPLTHWKKEKILLSPSLRLASFLLILLFPALILKLICKRFAINKEYSGSRAVGEVLGSWCRKGRRNERFRQFNADATKDRKKWWREEERKPVNSIRLASLSGSLWLVTQSSAHPQRDGKNWVTCSFFSLPSPLVFIQALKDKLCLLCFSISQGRTRRKKQWSNKGSDSGWIQIFATYSLS